jgi:hypothetical protein
MVFDGIGQLSIAHQAVPSAVPRAHIIDVLRCARQTQPVIGSHHREVATGPGKLFGCADRLFSTPGEVPLGFPLPDTRHRGTPHALNAPTPPLRHSAKRYTLAPLAASKNRLRTGKWTPDGFLSDDAVVIVTRALEKDSTDPDPPWRRLNLALLRQCTARLAVSPS